MFGKSAWLLAFLLLSGAWLYAAYSLVAAARFFVANGKPLLVEVQNEYAGHTGRRTFLATSRVGEVVLETNEALVPRGQYRLLYLTRDLVGDRRGGWLLPSLNSIRLKPEQSGSQFEAPIRRIELFDRFTVYMWGYVPEGPAPKIPVYAREGGVPWVYHEEGALGLLIENGPWYVWLLFIVGLLGCRLCFGFYAQRDWRAGSAADLPDFLHPALKRIDPDAPGEAPRPVAYKARPPEQWREAAVVEQNLRLPRSPKRGSADASD